MNPVLVFLVLIGAALFWLLCSFAYKFIGGIAKRMADDVKKAMLEEEEEIKDEN